MAINLVPQNSGAMISEDEKYRYALWRTWDKDKPVVMFIMLNPSTADGNKDDPTIRKCMAYAKAWGYGALIVGNLYAFKTKDPKVLENILFPIGPHCDSWLYTLSKMADLRIAAWGNKILSDKRVEQVKGILSSHMKGIVSRLYYLELSKSGNPKHPLYLRKNLKPQPW